MDVGSSHVRLTFESVLNRVWQGVDWDEELGSLQVLEGRAFLNLESPR